MKSEKFSQSQGQHGLWEEIARCLQTQRPFTRFSLNQMIWLNTTEVVQLVKMQNLTKDYFRCYGDLLLREKPVKLSKVRNVKTLHIRYVYAMYKICNCLSAVDCANYQQTSQLRLCSCADVLLRASQGFSIC